MNFCNNHLFGPLVFTPSHRTHLLKTLQLVPISVMVKTKVILQQSPLNFLALFRYSLSLNTLEFHFRALMFVSSIRNILSELYVAHSLTSFRSLLQCHLLRKPFLSISNYTTTPSPRFPSLFFSTALTVIPHTTSYHFCCLSPPTRMKATWGYFLFSLFYLLSIAKAMSVRW